MKPAALRLALTAVLFVGWIGYLGYLAWTTSNPVVLSRPQVMVSDLDVIAHPDKDGGPDFVIDEVLYPQSQKEDLKGKTIGIEDINKVDRFVFVRESWHEGRYEWRHDQGQFTSDRKFLLPLRPAALPTGAAEDKPYFQVVPMPASPGYQGAGPGRAYPADPAVIRQYHTIPKP
jgi:hypothetical protein